MSKPLPRERPKAVAVDFVRLIHSPSTCEDINHTAIPMNYRFVLPFFLIVPLMSQEVSTDRATLVLPILREPAVETPPQPVLRLEVPKDSIIESKTVISDGQKITIQEIEPIALPPIPQPPPLPPLTAEQISARAAQAEKAQKHIGLMLSCTIFDGKHTLIRGITRNKDKVQQWELWSNINFRHFNGLHRFEKNDIIHTLFFGIGDVDTTKDAARFARFGRMYTPPAIPELPADATLEPRFIVTKGNPNAEDLSPIIGLHEIYQEHHQDLIGEYLRIKANNERNAAERLANPPDPKPDIIIQHWIIDPSTQTENKGGESK